MFGRMGIDFRATLPQTVAGLVGGVVAYRYLIKPVVSNEEFMKRHQQNNPLNKGVSNSSSSLPPSQPSPSSTTKPPSQQQYPSSIQQLDSIETLEKLGRARAVILFARGYSPQDVAAARKAFDTVAVTTTSSSSPSSSPSSESFFIVDDESAQGPAATLIARLGITHEKPYVVILDRFLETENKYLMHTPHVPSTKELSEFVHDFQHNQLSPARLGQARPPHDRSEHCAELTEVVTESFNELVLDPSKDVLLESYSRRCDACKAFAPRYRMLAQLAAAHMPQLRVAAMDIQENDRDPKYLPEKWSPALRLFPATSTSGGSTSSGGGKGIKEKKGTKKQTSKQQQQQQSNVIDKPSILLRYGDENNNNSSENNNSENASTGHSVTTSESGQKVYLPTLLELLHFVEKGTSERLHPSPQFKAAAEKAEEEASLLESAYDQTLQYMKLWQAYTHLLDDIEEEEQQHKAAAKTITGTTQSHQTVTQEHRQVAETFKALVIDAYSYIVDEASLNGLKPAMKKLDTVAAWVDANGISDAIAAATASQQQQLEEHSSSRTTSRTR